MKKKNLLKCLALTSMLALSVGAVTSCGTQGEAGKDGAQGAQGVQGAQGEKGDKGDKGDTSYEVIILQSEVSGGKVTSSAYTGIKGDSPVLTFSPTTEGEVVISLTINYEDVALTDEILGGSLKLTFADQSFIVTATFGSVKDYCDLLIDSYITTLYGKDNQVNISAARKTALGITDPTGWKASDYYGDMGGAEKAAATYKAKEDDTITALGDEPTTKETIEAMKKLAGEAETAITEAYDKDVKAAKVAATTAITALDTAFAGNTNFAATDRASILADGKDAIDKATTVQELALIVNAVKDSNSQFFGSYNRLYSRKTSAFAAIDSALGKVEEIFDGKHETELTALKAKLAEYDIEVGSLPSEVAKEWYTKISAAKDLPVYTAKPETGSTETYKKGDVIMGYEGAKAVKASYQGVKDQLVEAIKKSYNAEIDASNVLGENGKVTFKGVVNSAVNTWIGTLDISGSYSILNYLSTDVADAISGCGLIGYIEQQMQVQIDTIAAYSGFGAERKATVTASALTELNNYLDTALSDTVYSSLLDTTDSDASETPIVKAKIGVKDKTEIANPLYGDLSSQAAAPSDGSTPSGNVVLGSVENKATADSAYQPQIYTLLKAITGTGARAAVTVPAFTKSNVNDYYDTIVSYNTDGTLDANCPWAKFIAGGTVLEIKAGVADLGDNFSMIHEGAVDLYEKAQKATIGATAGTGTNVVIKDIADSTYDKIDVTAVKGFFDALLPQKTGKTPYDIENTSFSDVSKAIKTIYDQQGNLNEINVNLVAWGKKVNDGGFDFTSTGSGSAVYKAVLDAADSTSIVSNTLAGSYANAEAVDKAMESMDDIYAAGVASYLEDAKKSLLEGYNKVVAGKDPSIVAAKKVTYNGLLALVGGSQYVCKTYASVKNWLDHSLSTLGFDALTYTYTSLGAPTADTTYNEGNATVSAHTDWTDAEELTYNQIVDVKSPTTGLVAGNLTDSTKAYLHFGFDQEDNLVNGNFYYYSFKLTNFTSLTGYDINKAYMKVNGTLRYAPVADPENRVIANSADAYNGSWIIAVHEAGKKTIEIEVSPDGVHSYFIKVNVDITSLVA